MSRPLMFGKQCKDERAWTACTIDTPTSWYYTLSKDSHFAFEALIKSLQHDSRTGTEISIKEPLFDTQLESDISMRSACQECLEPIQNALNAGRGFAIIEPVSIESATVREKKAIYWVIGQFLGTPFAQNIEGTLLYDVRDTGRDVAKGARFSVTNADSSFHVDGAFADPMPDIVGLLCLRTAKSGGRSQLISAYAIHNELFGTYPDVLETLYGLFYFDRRGQFKQGDAPTCQFPIFHWEDQRLIMRYLHYYIKVGHNQVGQPLTPKQEKALKVLQMMLQRPDFRIEFSLKPGQMLFTNNRWILHNRTEFEDYLDPNLRRYYIRLWLKDRS